MPGLITNGDSFDDLTGAVQQVRKFLRQTLVNNQDCNPRSR